MPRTAHRQVSGAIVNSQRSAGVRRLKNIYLLPSGWLSSYGQKLGLVLNLGRPKWLVLVGLPR